MPLLLGLLVLNAVLHGIEVARFGVRDDNQPFLVFALVYAALAVVVYLSVPYASGLCLFCRSLASLV
jgi:hypothetical protein